MRAYPGYTCAKHIKTEGRVILVDVPLNTQVSAELIKLKSIDGKGLSLLDVQEAAEFLEPSLQELADQKDTLFVFPGNGANFPRSRSVACKGAFGVGVFAKRFWMPGSEPIVMAGQIMPEFFMNLQTKAIIVIDDVISSGKTMQKLHENNSFRFPRAKWIGLAWFSQVLRTKPLSGIRGYGSVFASVLVGGVNGKKVPINSLSTLRGDAVIAQSYAKRHYVNTDEFLRLIRV